MDRTWPHQLVGALALVAALSLLATLAPPASSTAQHALQAGGQAGVQIEQSQRRWLQLDADALTRDAALLDGYLALLTNAVDLGYNGVILRGNQTNALGRNATFAAHLAEVATHATDLEMEAIFSYGSLGRCTTLLLQNDAADLTAAYPVVMPMELDRTTGVLSPAAEPELDTGFAMTFGETLDGNGTLRARLIVPTIGGQYRASVQVQGDLGGGSVTLRAVDDQIGQQLNAVRINPATSETTTTLAVPFNAFASDRVRILLETSGQPGRTLATSGFVFESVPTLNLVSRDGAVGDRPAQELRLFTGGGGVTQPAVLVLGRSNGLTLTGPTGVSANDSILGTWNPTLRTWSVTHTPPRLSIDPNLIPDTIAGEAVTRIDFAGWHGLPNTKGASCSWNDPAVFGLIEKVAAHATSLGATGHLLPFDEVHSGGLEPDDRGATAAESLAMSIAGAVAAVQRGAGDGSPVFVFGDMIDPTQNAVDCYFHVGGSLANSPGLPGDVIVLNWDEPGAETHFGFDGCRVIVDAGYDAVASRTAKVAAMNQLAAAGQMIAAYYDHPNVEQDYLDWSAAIDAAGSPPIAGVIYTAWDAPDGCGADLQAPGCPFEHIEAFAELWWGATAAQSDPTAAPTATATATATPTTTPTSTATPTPTATATPTPTASPTAAPTAESTALPPEPTVAVTNEPVRTCDGFAATITGSIGDDELMGTDGDDVIWGGPGNDAINGGGGNDVICGGEGDDVIYASAGHDVVRAGPGRDEVYGGPENDEISGGPGDDHLWGGPGNDILLGGDGDDMITGGSWADRLFGQAGADQLFGGYGDDELDGGEGLTDACWGNDGDDHVLPSCELPHPA